MISIFSGAQMFSLGIIGEYLARAHFRLLDKPPYVVRKEPTVSLPLRAEKHDSVQ
jgi:undecaprenyl-phosphate 4-deoxy-4-formamido-L-arabinose transferase